MPPLREQYRRITPPDRVTSPLRISKLEKCRLDSRLAGAARHLPLPPPLALAGRVVGERRAPRRTTLLLLSSHLLTSPEHIKSSVSRRSIPSQSVDVCSGWGCVGGCVGGGGRRLKVQQAQRGRSIRVDHNKTLLCAIRRRGRTYRPGWCRSLASAGCWNDFILFYLCRRNRFWAWFHFVDPLLFNLTSCFYVSKQLAFSSR